MGSAALRKDMLMTLRSIRTMTLGLVVLAATIGAIGLAPSTSGTAHADPFLCPVVSDSVVHADEMNGDHGVSTITPPVGTSFSPGGNQAGVHANPQAHNALGPDNPAAGPGHNPDFSPIWPGC